MVSMLSLWLPILLSAVAVFIVSAVLHMFLKYHASDFSRLPAEDQVRDALRAANVTPGEYAVPHAGSMEEMQSAAYIEKRTAGPVAFVNVLPAGPPTMTAELAQWFVFTLFVSGFAAYLASRAVGPGATYLEVFRFAGAGAFAAYALGTWQESIWFKRSWTTTLKTTFDGLVYALVTAGMFGWLWPA